MEYQRLWFEHLQINSPKQQLCMSIGNADTLTQNTDFYQTNQRWIFEDTIQGSIASVYEPFNYTVGDNLNGLGTSGNGWGGAWTVYEGTAADMTIQPSTDYTGLNTKGNKLTANLSASTALRAYRDLNPRWEDDGHDIWISFLMEITNPSSIANSWQAISLFNGATERILIGKDWGKSNLGILGYDASENVSSISAYNLPQSWIVVLIKTSGDSQNEPAYMWINPDPKTEPQIADADVSSTVQINNGIDRIVCHLGNTAGIICNYDEIRLAKSFSSIVPSGTIDKTHPMDLGSVSYPNPFNSSTTINFNLADKENVNLEIYDVLGRTIGTLISGVQPARGISVGLDSKK